MIKANLFAWQERAPLPLPRAGCAAGVLDGKFVVAGGTYWRGGREFWCERVDSFDPVANRWEPRPAMPKSRGDSAAAVLDDVLYVFGGGMEGPAEDSVWSFRHDSWSSLPQMTLPAPRRSSAIAILDGTIYLFGGLAGTGSDFAAATSTVWAAKPGTAWEVREPIPGPVRFNAAIGAVAGTIVVAGGCTPENGGVRNLDDILSYHPRTNRWTHVGRLPVPIRGACGLADKSRFLLIGGYTDKFERGIIGVDPQSWQISIVGGLPIGLADTRFLPVGSDVIGVSGENGIKMRFAGTLQSGPGSF